MKRSLFPLSRGLLTYALELPRGVNSDVKLADESEQAGGKRWMRGGFETCVQNVFSPDKLLNNYVAHYKFSDPQWRPLLQLPVGHPTGIDMRARHVNVALRHLVQKGHAVYLILDSQHTVFHPRGIAERSFVMTSMGHRNERLRCQLIHEGPIDGANPHGERGVVAVSVSNSMAKAFERRTMLVERSRRIGTIQAGMGAYDWTLLDPRLVGRNSQEEVFLLHDATRVLSGAVQTGGIVSSANIAKHPYHYVTEFEAPSTVLADINVQMGHFVALQHQMFDAPNGEPLHCMAYSTQGSAPRGVPMEVDLPFKGQISAPIVSDVDDLNVTGTIGDPWCSGAPIMRMDSQLFQGSPEYLYDMGPIHRPIKWWQQSDCLCAETVSYYVRDGNLPKLKFHEIIANPFLKGNAGSKAGIVNARWFGKTDDGHPDPVADLRPSGVATPSPSEVQLVDSGEASSKLGTAGSTATLMGRNSSMDVADMPWLQPSAKVKARVARSNKAAARVRGFLTKPKRAD